jgi:EEF1A lysine methyltransferase 2
MVSFLDEFWDYYSGSSSGSGSSLSLSLSEQQTQTQTQKTLPPLPLPKQKKKKQDLKILDLGTGNGSLLFSLSETGFGTNPDGEDGGGRLLGVDYSAESVRLAEAVASSRFSSSSLNTNPNNNKKRRIEFKEWDILRGDPSSLFPSFPSDSNNISHQKFDLVLDKGTFDAISLSGETDSLGRRVSEGYAARVADLLTEGGIFLVTSCNWTEAELQAWFEGTTTTTTAATTTTTAPDDGKEKRGTARVEKLRKIARIDYPSFSFGGVKGQTISSLCFQKVVVAAED